MKKNCPKYVAKIQKKKMNLLVRLDEIIMNILQTTKKHVATINLPKCKHLITSIIFLTVSQKAFYRTHCNNEGLICYCKNTSSSNIWQRKLTKRNKAICTNNDSRKYHVQTLLRHKQRIRNSGRHNYQICTSTTTVIQIWISKSGIPIQRSFRVWMGKIPLIQCFTHNSPWNFHQLFAALDTSWPQQQHQNTMPNNENDDTSKSFFGNLNECMVMQHISNLLWK